MKSELLAGLAEFGPSLSIRVQDFVFVRVVRFTHTPLFEAPMLFLAEKTEHFFSSFVYHDDLIGFSGFGGRK